MPHTVDTRIFEGDTTDLLRWVSHGIWNGGSVPDVILPHETRVTVEILGDEPTGTGLVERSPSLVLAPCWAKRVPCWRRPVCRCWACGASFAAGCTMLYQRDATVLTRISRQGFQYVKVKGFQRQFAHPAPIFFERFLTEISRGCMRMFLHVPAGGKPGYARICTDGYVDFVS